MRFRSIELRGGTELFDADGGSRPLPPVGGQVLLVILARASKVYPPASPNQYGMRKEGTLTSSDASIQPISSRMLRSGLST